MVGDAGIRRVKSTLGEPARSTIGAKSFWDVRSRISDRAGIAPENADGDQQSVAVGLRTCDIVMHSVPFAHAMFSMMMVWAESMAAGLPSRGGDEVAGAARRERDHIRIGRSGPSRRGRGEQADENAEPAPTCGEQGKARTRCAAT